MDILRSASAVWQGNLMDGVGHTTTGSGACSFQSGGTSPSRYRRTSPPCCNVIMA